MPERRKRSYEKKAPFRDACIFLIICEGEKREPGYFQFFSGISSRINVLPVPSEHGKSAPAYLIDNARREIESRELKDRDEIWFVLDVDRWGSQLNEVDAFCRGKGGCSMALSNPYRFLNWQEKCSHSSGQHLIAFNHIQHCNL